MARRSGGSPTHRVSSIPVQPWTMEGGGGWLCSAQPRGSQASGVQGGLAGGGVEQCAPHERAQRRRPNAVRPV